MIITPLAPGVPPNHQEALRPHVLGAFPNAVVASIGGDEEGITVGNTHFRPVFDSPMALGRAGVECRVLRASEQSASTPRDAVVGRLALTLAAGSEQIPWGFDVEEQPEPRIREGIDRAVSVDEAKNKLADTPGMVCVPGYRGRNTLLLARGSNPANTLTCAAQALQQLETHRAWLAPVLDIPDRLYVAAAMLASRCEDPESSAQAGRQLLDHYAATRGR